VARKWGSKQKDKTEQSGTSTAGFTQHSCQHHPKKNRNSLQGLIPEHQGIEKPMAAGEAPKVFCQGGEENKAKLSKGQLTGKAKKFRFNITSVVSNHR